MVDRQWGSGRSALQFSRLLKVVAVGDRRSETGLSHLEDRTAGEEAVPDCNLIWGGKRPYNQPQNMARA